MSATDREMRIYVACLAAYNAGRLHGRWIDATQDVDDIWTEVKAMLAASPEPGAEEWAIHDYEGFSPWSLSEWESFEKVSLAAQLADKKGEAVFIWLANDDTPLQNATDVEDLEEAFDEAYRGQWDSERDYAEELVSSIGLPGIGHVKVHKGPDWNPGEPTWVHDEISSYLDWDALTRWALEDAWTGDADQAGGGIHVFVST